MPKLLSAGRSLDTIELPTLAIIAISYGFHVFALFSFADFHPALWVVLVGINLTFFMSITHEVVHGHPTRSPLINSLLVLFPIAWTIPYERFKDTHMQHHKTGELTDPFDDPESWYLYEKIWSAKSRGLQHILTFNNTLFGRMLIGPIIGMSNFYICEISTFRKHPEKRAYLAFVWAKHLCLCLLMAVLMGIYVEVPIGVFLMAIYLSHSFLYIRTFLEHQAAPDFKERTVIIQSPCPIAFLFLFNNYHIIHHDYPSIPWYRLPKAFHDSKEDYLSSPTAYVYNSYYEIFRRYFFKVKEPIAHPFLRL